MATFKRDDDVERKMAERLGIDTTDVRLGSLKAEYASGEKAVQVTWECIRFVPVEEFNTIMTEVIL